MAEQLFQIGIKGLIRDKQGKVLLLKVPAWDGNPEYWDMPGGRMDPGETFVQTLRRELQEEIGVDYTGEPRQLGAVLSSVKITVGDARVSLVLVPYEVRLPDGIEIKLNPADHHEGLDWFTPAEAAKLLAVKYTPDFCEMVAAL